MKRLLSIAVIVAVAGLAGCAKHEPAPPVAPEATPAETVPISTEDFESGEVENAVQGAEEAVDDPATEGDQGEGQ